MAGVMHGRGHAWQEVMCGGGHAWLGMHGRGHAWQEACIAGLGHAWQILRDTVNEQVVHILLEFLCFYRCLSVQGGVYTP